MKILPVGADLFRAEGRADEHTDPHDEANSGFSQFWEGGLTCLFKSCVGTAFSNTVLKER